MQPQGRRCETRNVSVAETSEGDLVFPIGFLSGSLDPRSRATLTTNGRHEGRRAGSSLAIAAELRVTGVAKRSAVANVIRITDRTGRGT